MELGHWPEIRDLLNTYCGYNLGPEDVILFEIDSAAYFLADIGLRMLTPRELYMANGFPVDYKIERDYTGTVYPKTKQVARCGNAVPPPFGHRPGAGKPAGVVQPGDQHNGGTGKGGGGMKTEELIRVIDRELDSLRYNLKVIKDRETWTEETEGIFLQFRHEEEALQEIRTILSRMPDEEGPLTLEQLREKNGKPVWIVEYPDWGHWELSEDANDYITDRDPELYGLTYPDPEGKAGTAQIRLGGL